MPAKGSINVSSVSSLARSYNTLDFFERLRNIVSHTYLGNNIDQYTKRNLHWLINEILIEHYKGETTLKAKLVDLFVKKDVTAAFEIRVNKSRADFLTINGETRSFEIKSGLDNLYKLPKQISDYQKVFDHNYVVVDEIHHANAMKLIPPGYGVMVLHGHILTEDRQATANSNLDSATQLSLFTKKEFGQFFKIAGANREEVLMNFETEEINSIFKKMLKARYEKKWAFLKSNQARINSIDYQFFFQHNISPDIIYGSN